MKWRIVIILALLVAALAAALAWRNRAHRPALIQGRTASEWAAQLFAAPNQNERDIARSTLHDAGSNAVPALLAQLTSRDAAPKQWLLALLPRLPPFIRLWALRQFHPLEVNDLHAMAARALNVIGPPAAPAAPALAAALANEPFQVRMDAAAALGSIGKAALPHVAPLLLHSDQEVRHLAAYAIGQIGPDAAGTAPVLASLLGDRDSYVRASAGNALKLIGTNGVRFVIEQLSGDSPIARAAAARALAQFYAPKELTFQPMLKLVRDPDATVRAAAIDSLMHTRTFDKAFVAACVEALGDGDDNVRLAATKALEATSWKAAAAVPGLEGALKSENAALREWSALALGKIGAPSSNTLTSLQALLADNEPAVRAAASNALGQISGKIEKQP